MQGYTLFATKFSNAVDSVVNISELLGTYETITPNDFIDDLSEIEDIIFSAIEQGILFKVRGNSMKEAGIYDGDIAVVDQENKAKQGDIIIAKVENKYIIRYLKKNAEGGWVLHAANRSFKPITDSEFEIFGVVTSVIRNLKQGQ